MDLVSHHHEEQKDISRSVISELGQYWWLLNFHELRDTTPKWLKMVVPVVEKGCLKSATVAAEFVKHYRTSVHPLAEPFHATVPERLTRQSKARIAASLTVTGPVWMAQRCKPGMDTTTIPQIKRDGFSKVSGAVVRMVLNGGRGMVRSLAGADPLARGVAGIADPDACNGCQFLTTPVMKSDGEKKMDAVAVGHDFCTCSVKPIY